MLDVAKPKKQSFYYKVTHLWTYIKKRRDLAKESVKDSTYYEFNLDHFFKLEHYIDLYNNTLALNQVKTPENIQPGILGLSTKTVVKKNGRPSFIFKENDITIYIYKWKFNGLKNRCKVHFYKNEAFLINHDYQSLTSAEKTFVHNAVVKKYLSPATRDDVMLNCKIVDRHNNIIFFREVLEGLTVTYLNSADAAWFTSIKTDIEKERAREATKTELINKKFHSVV